MKQLQIVAALFFISCCSLGATPNNCDTPSTAISKQRILKGIRTEIGVLANQDLSRSNLKPRSLDKYELNVLEHMPQEVWACVRIDLYDRNSASINKNLSLRSLEFLMRLVKFQKSALDTIGGKKIDNDLLFRSEASDIMRKYKKLKPADPLRDDPIHQEMLQMVKNADRIDDDRIITRFTAQ